MDYIIQGFAEAFRIILRLEPEFIQTVLRSLVVSVTATILASAVAVPVFVYLGSIKFKGEGILSRLLNTLMSTPSVIVGLLVMLFLARRGPLGPLKLLYSVEAMIIAQFFLVLPLISAQAYELSKSYGRRVRQLGVTLGAKGWGMTVLIVRELKDIILIYVITAFSRAISEVGTVMMVGGNIEGKTRVMTTTISMLNSMGEYEMAIALGVVLVAISFVINWVFYSFKNRGAANGS